MPTTKPSVEQCLIAFSSPDYIIGQGGDRIGFHIPGTEWVYKLGKHPKRNVNRQEFERYEKLKEVEWPRGVCLPEMHLLDNGALASEYIDGVRPKARVDEVDFCATVFGLDDIRATCNIRVTSEGKIYVIDLGE